MELNTRSQADIHTTVDLVARKASEVTDIDELLHYLHNLDNIMKRLATDALTMNITLRDDKKLSRKRRDGMSIAILGTVLKVQHARVQMAASVTVDTVGKNHRPFQVATKLLPIMETTLLDYSKDMAELGFEVQLLIRDEEEETNDG